ncbi:fatty acyl-AMP ligase [Actinomadura sp. KC06]|uniref:fatty acyl-AMP ligase n=1 Tax=Actinomadura sp. KC06 TaxID=2530369 RepID=UPI001045F4D0|nr:fatty acyl-AMP ligase [Actinomadura sp. KC06]TDD37564.1 fatty acyl-AMP ligase [Actinomadura sp. KC06]
MTTVSGTTVSGELLTDAIRRNARAYPDRPAMVFGGGGRLREPAETLTYGRLDERARAVAAELRRRCSPGDRAVLLCAHDAGYPVAFLACLYAGVVAVPLYAPELIRSRERLLSVIGDCAPAAVLTTTQAIKYVSRALQELRHREPLALAASLIDVHAVPPAEGRAWRGPDLSGDALAYLQYTSGSTGTPTGVRITHANLAVTGHQMRVHFPDCRVTASWVPFFHDMGLICGIAWPLSSGVRSVQLSPEAFLREPHRWLQLISEHRAECSITPNFGLVHCVRRVTDEQKSTLDLSSLRTLHIAGEPVRADSVRAFADAFAACGLDPSALAPSYGLAEATLAGTAPEIGAPVAVRRFDRRALADGLVRPAAAADTAVELVGCGVPAAGLSVRITDPDAPGRALPADRVGEIALSGPNIADGYWNLPERSAEVFAGGGVRTGDLGFEHDGHLYIVGRTKDVIIVRGRNHHPTDIEATAGRPGLTAVAFSAAGTTAVDEEERLVVLLEAGPETPHLSAAVQQVREDIARHHGLVVHDLLIVRRGSLPRTTSGKIRRGACRDRYLGGRLAIAPAK